MTPQPVPLNKFSAHQSCLKSLRNLSPASLPVPNPTRPFWLYPPKVNQLAKEGSEGALTNDADICIIGSGMTGTSAVYHLLNKLTDGEEGLKAPLKIVVLEARDFCSGATGRNGGHLHPAAFLGFAHDAKVTSPEDAQRQIFLESHCADSMVDFIRTNGLESVVDLVSEGRIDMFFTEEEETEARTDYGEAEKAGVDLIKVKWIEKEEMIKKFGAPYLGVHTPGHNVWPMKFVTQLYLHAQHAAQSSDLVSLRLHTNTPVTSITPTSNSDRVDGHGRRYTINTPRGSVQASIVIHATNGYASYLLPHLAGSAGIVPTRGQVAAIPIVNSDSNSRDGLDWLGRSAWSGNQRLEYWFPRPCPSADPSRLIILGGAREVEPQFEFGTTDDSVVNEDVSKALEEFLPATYGGRVKLAASGVEREWTGIMGFTVSGDPFFGPVIDPANPSSGAFAGQYISAGYTGHGMPRAFACAEALAGLILHELQGKPFADWPVPNWLPRCYLTWERGAVFNSD